MGLELILLAVVGTVSGFLNVMAGGGSMLTVPLMIFLGMPGPVANATNRVAILAQNATAVTTFYRKGFADFKLSLSLAACTIPGAVLGAYTAANIRADYFNQLLAVIMLVIMVVMWAGDRRKPTEQQVTRPSRKRLIWGHVLMVFAGLWGGFIQIGVGFILMPILHRVMGLDLIRTNMHKVLIVLVYTAIALLVFASQLQIVWIAGIALALGNSLGGWFGAHFQVKKGVGAIKWVLNIVLVAFIIKLLFFPN